MAASSKQHLVLRLSAAGLSVPALALITGFAFSLTLPSSLHALIPAVESLFLVSLPHLWHASLSWITPPCLFVLLNGIIMILTATSRRSFSSINEGSSEREPNLPTQIENVPFKQSAANLEHTLAEQHASTAPILDRTFQRGGTLDTHITLSHSLYAQSEEAEVVEIETLKEGPCHDGYGDDKQLVFYTNPQDTSPPASEINPNHDATEFTSSSSVASEDIPVKAASEPSSPHFSLSPPMKTNMRRSMSIDSVPFMDDNGDGASEQLLSEEAFKKRIDDFILRMNSKIRSETRVGG